jgi:hypothetical protein
MAITIPKPKTAPASVEEFINGAPDAARAKRGRPKGKSENKKPISVQINEELLAKADELAAKMGYSRTALINMALAIAVENGVDFSVRKKG